MVNRSLMVLAVAAFLALCGCSSASKHAELPAYGSEGKAQLFGDLGSYTRKVTTSSPTAQEYFNQGLNWLYAFNHDEAVRSFTKAAELDPGCAMAWWGIAYAQGPNYNDPMMTGARNIAAWAALQRAIEELDTETAAERALVHALEHRYENPAPENRRKLESAFVDAMKVVWEAYPDDPDVGTMYAESIMLQHPWMLYTIDEQPAYESTNTIVLVLEDVLAKHPEHPGANHLYIHAIEPSDNKERAIPAADRLSGLVPASGHLQHMPSHIYVQVGMWDRAIDQNIKALESDARYRAISPKQAIQYGYMAHNAHMLAFSAMMVGREKEAMAAARSMWSEIPAEALKEIGPFIDPTMCSVYDVQKRFGRWDDLLAEPAPPTYLPITTAMWRAHRAVAYAAKKDFDNAEKEQAAFRTLMRAVPGEYGFGVSIRFLLVSEFFIAGEFALQHYELDEAAGLLEQAVEIEDAMGYGEPPAWLQPTRHTLGAVYLKAGRFADAERVYRDDLAKWPGNGWSLYGLSRALEEQGKTDEAQEVRAQYETVWAGADESNKTSCKCISEL